MPAGNLTDEDLKHILSLLGASAQDEALRTKIEADLPAPVPTTPVLTVSAGVLKWTAVTGTNVEYEVAEKVGAATIYVHDLKATTYTPVVVPGQTIIYSVHEETPVKGPWSNEVSISFPAPPPLSGVNTCLPGVCLNGGETLATRAGKAKALGAKVLRIEGSLAALATAALEAGAKAAPIITGNVPVAEYDALDATHKAALIALCGRNETWPGGIGQQMSGRAYGEWFIARAKEAKGLLPITCQVNFTPTNTAWTVELIATPGLAAALEGNYLDHHPYGVSMMNKLVNLTNPLDQSHGWESRRWMTEAWYVQSKLGIAVPSFLSELGGSLSHAGNWAKVVEEDAAIFQFLTMVKHGTVPVTERPGGAAYTPQVVAMTQYSLLGNRAGAETFGINFYDAEGGRNEEHERWHKWQTGAAELVRA